MDGLRQRTLDLRLRHGIHALEMHLRFEDLGRAGTELNVDVESTCSSFGRIVRIVGVVMERRQRPGKLQIKRVEFQVHELPRAPVSIVSKSCIYITPSSQFCSFPYRLSSTSTLFTTIVVMTDLGPPKERSGKTKIEITSQIQSALLHLHPSD